MITIATRSCRLMSEIPPVHPVMAQPYPKKMHADDLDTQDATPEGCPSVSYPTPAYGPDVVELVLKYIYSGKSEWQR